MNAVTAEVLHDELHEDLSTAFDAGELSVNDERAIGWALTEILMAEQRMADVGDVAQQRIDEINRWRGARQERLVERVRGLRAIVRDYLERTGQKSIELPEGTVRLRKLPARWERDELVLEEWVREAELPFIRTKTVEALDWAGLKKAAMPSPDGTATIKGAAGEELVLPSVLVIDQGLALEVEEPAS
ncbi:MAG: host-nuclease inhibitor Gam family protein [Candidatus Dormibacteria bacterium]